MVDLNNFWYATSGRNLA